jgi:1,4-dihydroxy-2-naphthoate octaprenyltransferase
MWASLVAMALAAGIGLILQFGYKTGEWAIFLGFLGMLGGFFYSAKPIRWVRTGLGELWIAFCYGWLTVAAGFYLQVGNVKPIVN